MAFQDFDQISERRRAERERKFKRRVTIGAVTAFALVALVCAGVVAVVNHDKVNRVDDSSNKDAKPAPSQGSQPTKEVSRVQKLIKTVCNATTYQDKCKNTLENAVKENPKAAQPKALLESAVAAASEEITKAFNKTETFAFNTPEEKAAFEDCKELINDAIDELNKSISNLGEKNVGKLTSKTPDLNNWLSAVMSYQSTCIDGFPNGTLKNDMKKAFNASMELTSNSLAMIKELTTYISTFLKNVPAANRRLLASDASSVDKDGFPTWMSHEDRRMLKAAADKPTPNVTVAKDGSGQFKTISEALAAMPEKYEGRYVIYVKEGVYDETVIVGKKMVNVTMYGDGSQKSIVTGSKNFVDGVRTFQTATFAALGDGFMAQAMGFRNTAGPEKHQAVAVRVQADRSIFLNCRFEGYQDTLYAQTHRQYYRSCVIAGTVDFIFGDAASLFQNCLIYIRKPLENQQNIITAQGRVDKFETTGIVLQNCRILADNDFESVKTQFKNYLGRPWKEFSRTIIMESEIPDFIHPDGWLPWDGGFALNTCYYAEYNNKGPGAKIEARVKWPGYKKITKQDAEKYTVGPFLQGQWIDAIGAPVHFGLF